MLIWTPLLLLLTALQYTQAFPAHTLAISTISSSQYTVTPTIHLRQASPSPTIPPQARNEYFLTTQYIIIDGFTNAHATQDAKTITLALPTCVQTIIPDKNGFVPPGTCGALYNYYPSFSAAIATGLLFGLLSIAHIVLAAKFKLNFCWVIIMGSLWETVAFLVRAISARQQQNTGLVLVAQLFVLLVPLWINAYIYILLSRLIYFVSPTSSILHIPAPFLSVIFVVLDFISFVVQMIGGMLAGPTASQAEQMKGIHIYMGGIGLQQCFIVMFIGIAVKFQLEMKNLGLQGKLDVTSKKGWEKLLWAIYAGLVFITIRIIYRLIEFSAGHDQDKNPLPYKEIYLYILEVIPMFSAIGVFIVVHPGNILKEPDAKMPGVWSYLKNRKGYRGGDRRRSDMMMLKSQDGSGVELVDK